MSASSSPDPGPFLVQRQRQVDGRVDLPTPPLPEATAMMCLMGPGPAARRRTELEIQLHRLHLQERGEPPGQVIAHACRRIAQRHRHLRPLRHDPGTEVLPGDVDVGIGELLDAHDLSWEMMSGVRVRGRIVDSR